ncbi:MAG: ABC transporter permease [Acidobacteriota bacterium]
MADLATATAGRRPGTFRRYFALILYKTYTELRAEASRTYFGYVWWVVEPVLSMSVYYFVFEYLFRQGTANFGLFLIIGLIPWRWFSTSITHGSSALIQSRALMKQVYLPKVVLPLVTLASNTFKFLVVFALLIAFLWLMGFAPGPQYLALVAVILVQGLLVGGLTLLAAAVTPFVPDLRVLLDNFLRLLFFVSGIFHDIDVLGGKAESLLRLNPLTWLTEAYREILLHRQWPDFEALLWIGACSAVVLFLAERLIRRFEFVYPKLSR